MTKPPKSPAPKCRACGKALKPNRPAVSFSDEAAMRAWIAQLPPTARPTIKDLSRMYGRPYWHVNYQEGYGNYGDSRWCGLNCAYRWAISQTGGYPRGIERPKQ